MSGHDRNDDDRNGELLLEVDGLVVRTEHQTLVEDLSFSVRRGSKLGIIGESGSGKTLTALSIMGLLPDGLTAEGRVAFEGRELLGLSEREMGIVRGDSFSMIFQEPMTALNPVMRIGKQIAEPLRIHQGMSRQEANELVVELLAGVGVDQPARRARAFPHELSGGQRQRAMIAMALACSPDLVIADEPTTALDVTVQAQVLAVLQEQVVANDAALILITHDLPVVASVTDDVLVLRDGRLVESGSTGSVFASPADVYTQALVDSVPPMSRSRRVELRTSPEPTEVGDKRSDRPNQRAIVRLDDVTKIYRLRRTKLLEPGPELRAVDGVSLDVRVGETFGIVGESGSGKSTLARLIVGLERATSGRVEVDGIEVSGTKNLRPLRDVVQMVFQDPMGSLDPRLRVDDIVAEPLRALGWQGDHQARVKELLDAVALPSDSVDRFPHEFSGGQRQRIAIARALAPGPRLLVADEPVSALDMSVQTVTLELLAELKREFDLTMIFISHDLSVVHEICERTIVLEHGTLVETGPVGQVFGAPSHPYTKRLVDAVPRLELSGG